MNGIYQFLVRYCKGNDLYLTSINLTPDISLSLRYMKQPQMTFDWAHSARSGTKSMEISLGLS